ncbi:MAG: ATP synthase F0 subunit C [Bdellovibrionales bacterium]|nr:ATP synthase F0 subunit C [Bdellovibrionales bacterium]
MKKNIFMFVTTLLAASSAFAQEAAVATSAAVASTAAAVSVGGAVGWAALGTGLMMGLAVFGGAFGQSKAANAALDGIARNPSAAKDIRGNLILALALMESLVLFALIIALQMTGAITKALAVVK